MSSNMGCLFETTFHFCFNFHCTKSVVLYERCRECFLFFSNDTAALTVNSCEKARSSVFRTDVL